jgi:hypothetical protein
MDTTPNYARSVEVIDNIVEFYGTSKLITKSKSTYNKIENILEKQRIKNIIQDKGKKILKDKKYIISMREPTLAAFSWYGNHIMDCASTMKRYIREQRKILIKAGVKYYPKSRLCKDHTVSHHCYNAGCNHVNLEVNKTINFETIHHSLYSFEQYIASSSFHISHGYFYDHLKLWSDVVGRKNIFVLSFDNIIKEPSNSFNSLAKFLNLKKNFGNNVTLPHDNDSSHLNLSIPCKIYEEMYKNYAKKNGDLYKLIEDKNKPSSQPYFPKFKIDERKICKQEIENK